MAKTFDIEIVTPSGTAFTAKIIHVRAPGVDGDFGVLADHAPLMAGLQPGRLHIDDPDESYDFALTGGFFEVHSNRAIVLAENCIRREDIDLERAEAAKTRALRMLEDAKSEEAVIEARRALAKAIAIIKVAEMKP